MSKKITQVFLVCPLHSKPGEAKAAILRPGPLPGSCMALCADCIVMGQQLKARLGMKMVQEVANVKREDIEAKVLPESKGEPCPTK